MSRRLLAGAAAGVAGTLAMSILMVSARKLGLTGALPPAKITKKALNLFMSDRKADRAAKPLAIPAHFAYGAGCGAILGLLGRSGLVQGGLFGSLVYGLSYMGWLPAFGVMPRPDRDRPGRQPVMLAAHLLYGGTTGVALRRLRERATVARAGEEIHS